MTIESIFSKINAEKSITLGPESHRSLEVFSDLDEVFYVPTIYDEIKPNLKAKFVIFSAPGASGKSALARFIAKKYKGIYWNLANIGIGENTFYGTLWRALKQDGFMEYQDKLKNGKSVLVIDAFDEAEMISGRTGIEYFLKDLNDAVGESIYPSVILLARTETATFLADYCIKNSIIFAQYEIGFFTETNAKMFIEKSYLNSDNCRRKKLQITPAITNAIEAFFRAIKNVLVDSKLYDSFIGYAPILQAIERTIEEESNTAKLLSTIEHKEGVSEQLIYNILEELINREQKKVINALKQKWVKKYTEAIEWGKVYSIEEQMVRTLEFVVLGKIEKDSFYEVQTIPPLLMDEYLEVILPFVGQHPFVQNFAAVNNIDFTGPAFRDFAVAYVICSEYDFLAKDFLANIDLPSHYPSQLLFDFYKSLSKLSIKNEIFPVLYDSFKAKEKKGYKSIISVSGGVEDLNATFSLVNDRGEEIIDTVYLHYSDLIKILSIERISDGYIDFDGIVEIKGKNNGSRIADSSIIAQKLIFSTDRIELDASNNNKLVLCSKQDVISTQAVSFDIRKATNGTIIIDFPNRKAFHKLIPFSGVVDGGEDIRYMEFKRFFIKVLNSMRAHSKDTPAKDKEKIDFLYIGTNQFRKAEMNYLVSKGIIFVDTSPGQLHLYKLRKEELAKYNINWTMINKGEDGKMKDLFEEFISENPDIILS